MAQERKIRAVAGITVALAIYARSHGFSARPEPSSAENLHCPARTIFLKPSTRTELKVGTRVLVDAKMDEEMKMYKSIGITEPAKPAQPKAGTTKTR